ncbi:MAG: HAD-IA family hydrolase [Anaerolineales bacterium]|nr:HAD-IA family hydrolase [Anaerolineales bacterium]
MDQIKALLFDVGGTVFDWKTTAQTQIEALASRHGAAIDSAAFADEWRAEMFRIHSQVRQGNLSWRNADAMHLGALENMTGRYPLLSQIDRQALVKATWHQLNAFAGAPEALNRLRSKYTVVVLTILSWASIVSSSKRAGVQWDGILSCEFLGFYKPSLEAYRRGVALLGLEPGEAMMVAAHEGDLAAAQQAGLHTAYVSVPVKDNVGEGFGTAGGHSFDIEAPDFMALCERLGV